MSKKTQSLIRNFSIVNSNNFIKFLKKFKLVEKSVVLEINGNNLFGKVRTPDKAVIKYVNIDINEVFEGDVPPERLKMGILEINRLTDLFKYFNTEDEINVAIECHPYENELIASKIKFSSSTLDIFIKCADISLLSYIDDEIQGRIHSTEGSEVNFPISKESFQRLSSLIGMETNAEELLNFDVKSDGVSVKGNSFQYQILKGESPKDFTEDCTYTVYKNQFSCIDQESSEVHFHENRIFVKSIESDSMIAIGLVEI